MRRIETVDHIIVPHNVPPIFGTMMTKVSSNARRLLLIALLLLLIDDTFAWLYSSLLPRKSCLFSSPDEEVTTSPIDNVVPELRQSQSSQLSANAMMKALGTSPRRIFVSFLSASGIALAGNFLGVTSRLLTNVPEDIVEASQLDTYFPRGDFKRCRGRGYTFVIPKEWVADTFVELAKAQRRVQPLDYSMSKSRQQLVSLPDSAYGPPGRLNEKGVSESGDTNVSVIVTTGLKGFSLESALGSPQNAAETLLRVSIAPEGSGRTSTLLNATKDANRNNVYQFEYIIDRGERGPPLRNIAVIAASPVGDAFYTLTVVAPVAQWKVEAMSTKLEKIASSFHLTGN